MPINVACDDAPIKGLYGNFVRRGRFVPNSAHQRQEAHKRRTEGENMQFGEPAPGLVGGDGNHGVPDPRKTAIPCPKGTKDQRSGDGG